MFDVLVVGEAPAAMVSATLLVRKGLKVAWVVSPAYLSEEGGRVASPVMPDITWDLLPRVLVQEILHRLGVPYRHLEKEDKQERGLQIVTPEFRTLPIDGLGELKRELKRLFPLGEGEINRVIQEEPEESSRIFLGRIWGPLSHRESKGFKRTFPLLPVGEGIGPHPISLEGVRLGPTLKRMLEITAFSQSYVNQWVFPQSLVRHFINNLCHLNIFAQGRLVSPDRIFREVFHMGGGELFPGEEGMRVEAHHEKGISLWVNPEEGLNGTVCLIAVSPVEAPEIFESLRVPHRGFEREEGGDIAWMSNIVFTIDEAGIPGGMRDNLIVYLGKATDPFSPEHLVFLSLEKVDSGKVEGHTTVFHRKEQGGEDTETWARAQIHRLETLFPFMTSHMEVQGWYGSGGHPLNIGRYFYGQTHKRRLGATLVKKGALGKNIHYIGRRQFDYLGLEGEILTGLMATQWTVDRLAKI